MSRLALSGGGGGLTSFDIPAAAVKAFSHVNFNTFTAANGAMHNAYRASSSALNDEVVFVLPQPMRAGTWTLVVTYLANATFAIYHVATSPDASTWTEHGTVDSYSATSVVFNRAELGPLTIPAGHQYVRLRMASRNAANITSYVARLSGISGTRTGA